MNLFRCLSGVLLLFLSPSVWGDWGEDFPFPGDTWIEGGSPAGANDVAFWSGLETLTPSFRIRREFVVFEPVLAERSFLATYGISIVGVDSQIGAPKAYLYGGSAKGTTTVTLYVALQYSDNLDTSNDENREASQREREYYLELAPDDALRRVGDSSPCPLEETPHIWRYSASPEGPLTFNQVRNSLFAVASGGSSTPLASNIWCFRYEGVPRGRYAFYASSSVGQDIHGSEDGTNLVVAYFTVENPTPSPASFIDIVSPSPNAVVRTGSPVTIRYRLATPASVLSWRAYSLWVGGRLLKSRAFDWGSQTQEIEESVDWVPTEPGPHVIEIVATDTECRGQELASGRHRFTVMVEGAPITVAGGGAPVVRAKVERGALVLDVPAATSGRSFRLQQRASLTTGAWADHGPALGGTGSSLSFPAVPIGSGASFFRVVEAEPEPKTEDWRLADLVFPAGTREVKVHFSDPYTLSKKRDVRIGVRGEGSTWGWSTWVYPDTSAALYGLENPRFYLAGGSGIGVLPFTGLGVIEPGRVHAAVVQCESVGSAGFFGRKEYEGLIVVDLPEVLVRGSRRFALKRLQPGESQRFTFAVAP